MHLTLQNIDISICCDTIHIVQYNYTIACALYGCQYTCTSLKNFMSTIHTVQCSYTMACTLYRLSVHGQ